MIWIECESSMVKRYAYDGKDMYVEYCSGKVYKYLVTQEVFEKMKAAESKGKFLASLNKEKNEDW